MNSISILWFYRRVVIWLEEMEKIARHHITLAAIRSYDSFLEKTLLKEKFAENVGGLLLMDEKKKEKAYQLIEELDDYIK